MKHKIILPIIGAMLLVVVVSLVVFASTSTSSKLNFDSPTTVKIYYKSQTVKATLYEGDDLYKSFMTAYNNTFYKTALAQISSDDFINPNIVENTEAPEWSEYNKDSSLYAELDFAKDQRLVIYRNGNSRVIKISSIIFEVTGESGVKDVNIYYAVNNSYINKVEETGDSEIYYPLIVEGDTSELYEAIRGII